MEFSLLVSLFLLKFTHCIKVYKFDDDIITGNVPDHILQDNGLRFVYNGKSLRKHIFNNHGTILGIPKDPEDLPRTNRVHPGHTLLRPALGMLKSQISFPHVDSPLVYGNKDNIGLRSGKNEYVLYTDFRKGNNMIDNLLRSVFQSIKKIDTEELGKPDTQFALDEDEETQNQAKEMFNTISNFGRYTSTNLRRDGEAGEAGKDCKDGKDGSSSSSSEAEAYDKNPGNPFTVNKGRYYQNWPWKLDMDGNHVNINPYAPTWDQAGSSAADLFFARKWWYYNQDDYVPF